MSDEDITTVDLNDDLEHVENDLKNNIETGVAPTHATEKIKTWPLSILFIIANEFCERFSFYGLKTILSTYLRDYLELGESKATFIVHLFISITYATAIFGGFLSDSYWGKFKTIIRLTCVYIVGSVLLAFGSIKSIMGDPPTPFVTFLALLLIGIGTGGIKSSVTAFVGDQFHPSSVAAISSVFMYFYFSINAGSLISTILTPILKNNSYALAYGIPAGLLFLSLIILYIGKKRYVMAPPRGNVIGKIFTIIKTAYTEKKNAKANGRLIEGAKFLSYASVKYSEGEIEDVRILKRIVVAFLPIPIYWSLFDQHASKWVFMAQEMENTIFGIKIQPEHVQFLNPLFLLLIVVPFDKIIYPFFKRKGITLYPLKHKMVAGMIFTFISFIVSGILQFYIYHIFPSKINVLWIIPQFLLMAIGEVLISTTGLDFSYSQSPLHLKSVVLSIWLATVSIGNIFVSIISLFNIRHRGLEFFLYAAMLILFTELFYLLTKNFKYKDDNKDTKSSPLLDQNSIEMKTITSDKEETIY